MAKYMYVVMSLKKEITVDVAAPIGRSVDIPLRWTPNMVGALAVFKTKAAADRYADKKCGVIKIQEVENV